ncbi:MAG: DUF2634 domain-containing protein [Lysinibacillus sp.]
MLPENELNIEALVEAPSIIFDGKAFLYDYKKQDFVYRNGAPVVLTGRRALEAWIEKVIRTTRFKYAVHDDIAYGINIEDLIGSSFPKYLVESEVEREITEALLANDYIERVSEWGFEFDGSLVSITFTVTSKEGAFDMNMEVAQVA